ncbi:MAG: PKD domain-containing protein [Bacteroidetes bacterium]|nr:PKD domain-containing protein [Bacteroidota bacterium]
MGGNYQVTLIATGVNGCSDTLVFPSTIVVNTTPNTAFSRTPASGCEPLTVTINNTSSLLNNPVYNWNFGDGTTSTLANNPPVVYSTPGVYTITLIVTNTGGCSDTTSRNVTVNPLPVIMASADNNVGCSPFVVSFSNTTTGAVTYLWDFGDGATSSSSNPSHTYSVAGVYAVTLIATSSNGCIDTLTLSTPITVNQSPVANFSRTPSSGCAPLTVTANSTSLQLNNPIYFWDFGNGNTSTSQSNIPQVYLNSGVYSIKLIVTNTGGCADSATKNVNVFAVPVASATVSDTIGCAPHSITFTNTSTGATTYNWNFGDGSTSTSASPSHVYNVPGNYTVSLIAGTVNGCSDTLILPQTINIFTAPVANYTNTAASGCLPLNVTFTNTSSSLSNPVYNWDFGNGQTSTLADPVVSFTTAGVFPVTLIVTNQGGCSDTIVKNITAWDVPVANAIPSTASGCNPMTITFTNTSANATSYLWNFGDGSTSVLTSPTHIYNAAGSYTVTLIASTVNGCSDTLVLPQTILINSTPVANFNNTLSSGCLPLECHFYQYFIVVEQSCLQLGFWKWANKYIGQSCCFVHNCRSISGNFDCH